MTPLNVVVLVAAVAAASLNCNGGGGGSPTQPPACSIALSPGTLAFGADGGTGSVTVSAGAGCSWTASVSASWITTTAGATGNGPGTIAYTVAANAAADARTATLTVGGQSHGVTQAGRPPTTCSYALSPGSADVGKDAAAGTFAVTAPAACAWTATSSAPWLAISAGGTGAGDGTVSYSVARNTDAAGRVATIRVADREFTVRQSGDVGICTYSVAPVEFNVCMPGISVTAVITTQASCPWTAVSNAPWLTTPSGSSGTGSGVITMALTENYDAPRQGIVMVRWPTPTAGQNLRVAQAGCLYAVTRTAISFTAGGGTGSFDVLQQSDPNTCGGPLQDRCVWSAVSNVPWITITSSMPRSGDNPVAFTVAANDGAAREGRITVRDKVVVISQAAR